MTYGVTVTLEAPFPEAVERVRNALQEEGFGVLTEIDVTATMAHKLGKQMEDYVILGACNPPLAARALDADRSIGLLLPCNVVVRADGHRTIAEVIDPHILVRLTNDPALQEVADDAGRRLEAVVAALNA